VPSSTAVLLPLLVGYLFLSIFYFASFRAQYLDGYRLLIESTVVGFIIFVVARGAAFWLHQFKYPAEAEQWITTGSLNFPFIGSTIIAVCIAVSVPIAGNLIVGPQNAKNRLIARHDNGFIRLFGRAWKDNRMVSVTLSNRKVYIGYVLTTPNLNPRQQFVGLLPIVSGYRDKDTLRLVPVIDYAKVISDSLTPTDFEITICIDSIDSANLFDPKAYNRFADMASSESNNPTTPRLA